MSRTVSIARLAISAPTALFSAVLLLWLAAGASADVPKKMNYQGRLLDAGGLPLAGLHSLTFRLYDSPTDGSSLWSESKVENADSNGVFSTVLGNVNPIEIGFTAPCWLEIEVDGEVLSPRREIASVPFAYRAEHADRADSAADAGMLGGKPAVAYADSSVDGHSLDADDGNPRDAVYVDHHGRVGVGTSTPLTFFDVRTLGSAVGGVPPYGEVLGHFRITGSDAHTAISIDAQPDKDAILYFAQDGASMWDLRNDTDAGDKFQLRWHRGGTTKVVSVDSTGFVGIATTTPNGPLHVESSISINNPGATNFANRIAPVVIGDGDGTNPCILIDGNQIEQADPTDLVYINFNSPGDIALAQGGGSVGIGTSTPDARLEVAGQVKITGGSPGEGKVLTSSSTGLGAWKAITTEYCISPLKALPVFSEGQGWYTLGSYLNAHSEVDAEKRIRIPLDVPSKISGVQQKVTSLTIYYSAYNCAIVETMIEKCLPNGSTMSTLRDDTSRSSLTFTSFTIDDPTPSPVDGSISLVLKVDFAADSGITIGTILLTTSD